MVKRYTRWIALGASAALLTLGACSDRKEGAQSRSGTATQQGADRTAGAGGQRMPGSPQAGSQAGGAAGAQAGAGEAKTVSGQVASAKQDEVAVKPEGGDKELKLKVDASTSVTIDGRQASAQELKEGMQVRASYDASQKATKIEAQGAGGDKAGGPSGMTTGSGPGTQSAGSPTGTTTTSPQTSGTQGREPTGSGTGTGGGASTGSTSGSGSR